VYAIDCDGFVSEAEIRSPTRVDGELPSGIDLSNDDDENVGAAFVSIIVTVTGQYG